MNNATPLYEWDQVVTYEDLHVLMHELYQAHQATPWWKWRQKEGLAGGFATVKILLLWLQKGKPTEGLNADIH